MYLGCVKFTALGLPVVPEVNSINIVSSGSCSAKASGSPAALSRSEKRMTGNGVRGKRGRSPVDTTTSHLNSGQFATTDSNDGSA